MKGSRIKVFRVVIGSKMYVSVCGKIIKNKKTSKTFVNQGIKLFFKLSDK